MDACICCVPYVYRTVPPSSITQTSGGLITIKQGLHVYERVHAYVYRWIWMHDVCTICIPYGTSELDHEDVGRTDNNAGGAQTRPTCI